MSFWWGYHNIAVIKKIIELSSFCEKKHIGNIMRTPEEIYSVIYFIVKVIPGELYE